MLKMHLVEGQKKDKDNNNICEQEQKSEDRWMTGSELMLRM